MKKEKFNSGRLRRSASGILLFVVLSGLLGAQEAGFSPERKPAACPPGLIPLLGQYSSADTLLFFESAGALYVRSPGMDPIKLEQLAPRTFSAGPTSHRTNSTYEFSGPEGKRPASVTVGGRLFTRRPFDGEDGTTFTITPLYSYEELHRRALRASPPREKGSFLRTELVELQSLDSTVRYDIRYASTNNFMKQQFYSLAKAYMQRPAADALIRAHEWLKLYGYGLLIHDAYRPWMVTKMFWDATPNSMKDFVANPASGSRHNRGCAVDVTLYDLASGQPIEMVSGYDEFSGRSHPDYPGGTSLQRWHRRLLREAFERNGFTVYRFEWWHFDYNGWERYRIVVKTFEDLK